VRVEDWDFFFLATPLGIPASESIHSGTIIRRTSFFTKRLIFGPPQAAL
jgi:hypothetical protein